MRCFVYFECCVVIKLLVYCFINIEIFCDFLESMGIIVFLSYFVVVMYCNWMKFIIWLVDVLIILGFGC